MLPDQQFWKGKKVLVTGHTGFTGAWLSIWLSQIGAKILGISLGPNTVPSLFRLCEQDIGLESLLCDVRNYGDLVDPFQSFSPDVVFHLAAQSLVVDGYRNPRETIATNVMGTCNILDLVRTFPSARAVVAVTTDKVYKPSVANRPHFEEDCLGGSDPYSASKGAAELLISSYADSFFADANVSVVSVRAGNIIGGGDWAEARIIPDALRSWVAREPLQLRRPNAVRPWQHVLEPVAAYIGLAESIWSAKPINRAYNIGPRAEDSVSVLELVKLAATAFGDCANINTEAASSDFAENTLLTLDSSLISEDYGYKQRWSIETAINATVAWYKGFYQGGNPYELCLSDIASFSDVGNNTS